MTTQERFAESARLYAEMVDIFPSVGELHFAMGRMQLRAGDPTAALATFNNFKGRRNDNWRLHLLSGRALKQLGRLDEAVGALRKATEIAPHHFQPAFILSRLMKRQGDFEQALIVARQAAACPDARAEITPYIKKLGQSLDV